MAAKEKTNVDIKQGKCCRLWEPSKGIKHFFKINCGLKALFYQVKVSHRGLQQLEPVLEGLGQPLKRSRAIWDKGKRSSKVIREEKVSKDDPAAVAFMRAPALPDSN